MSHEDCGFRPGKIDGPAACPHICDDCDGDHHWIIETPAEEDEDRDDYEPRFVCKHCAATAEMIDED